MSRIFAITAVNEQVSVGGDGRGEITFTVTNSSVRPMRGQLRVRPLGSTQREWLNIAGETERAFSPNATQQVVVKVNAPPGIPAGKYQFRLDTVSIINPDDDFTEGPTVDLEIKATEAPKKAFPWLIIAAAAGAVILIAAGIWLFWPSGGTKAVFEDNFEGATKAAWSATKTETTPNGKTRFLGQFYNDSVQLTLDKLPTHKTVTVTFDLYIIHSWDGNDPTAGPDVWGLNLEGGPSLINTTFSNRAVGSQSFGCMAGEDASNNCYSKGGSSGFGALKNSLGYAPVYNATDCAYKINYSFEHDRSFLILTFFGNLKEATAEYRNTGNEGWGLDNVRVEVK
jgi:hypothetical protein